jgi:hypothetical protein
VLATALAEPAQIIVDLAEAADAAALWPRLHDQHQQPAIVEDSRCFSLRAPGVLATRVRRHHSAQPLHRVLLFY